MDYFDDRKGSTCTFKPNMYRCIMALALPILTSAFLGYITYSKGYTIAEYYQIVFERGVNLFPELVYLISLCSFLFFIWPSAIRSIRYRKNALSVSDGRLTVFGRVITADVKQIVDVHIRYKYFINDLIVVIGGESFNCGSVTFICYWPDVLVENLKDCLAKPR